MLLEAQLQLCKQLLKLVRNAEVLVAMHLRVIPPREDAAAELRRHIECLNSTIHVAGGALIREAEVGLFTLALFKGRQASFAFVDFFEASANLLGCYSGAHAVEARLGSSWIVEL